MRSVIAATIIALSSGCANSEAVWFPRTTEPVEEPVTVEYDRFSDSTDIQTARQPAFRERGHEIEIDVTAYCQGEGACAAEAYHLRFHSQSAGWRYLEGAHLILLVDGEREIYNNLPRIGDVVYGGEVYEMVTLTLSREDAERIAAADLVEAQLGPAEFVVDTDRFRLLLEMTR